MLLSMTGHGDARGEGSGVRVSAEIRSVNGRYFKLNFRCADAPLALEGTLEPIVRESVRRGNATLIVRIERQSLANLYRIRSDVLDGYRKQLAEVFGREEADRVPVATLLTLPGSVEEPDLNTILNEAQIALIEKVVQDALKNLNFMRQREGEAMSVDLRESCQAIAEDLEAIALRAPLIAAGYRDRIVDRINGLLADLPVRIDESDVLREVGLFAERTDISEEIVRLRSHLIEFGRLMKETPSAGRKLDFLIQEMFREINTIGSKASDTDVARNVVQIKNRIERMREMIQNVE